jgi:hypothetical protein
MDKDTNMNNNYSSASGFAGYLKDVRKESYDEAGCSIEDLIVAMWEANVERRPDKLLDIQKKRLAVKAKYPKK